MSASRRYWLVKSEEELRGVKGLEKMVLLQRGSRLSVGPVGESEFRIIETLGGRT